MISVGPARRDVPVSTATWQLVEVGAVALHVELLVEGLHDLRGPREEGCARVDRHLAALRTAEAGGSVVKGDVIDRDLPVGLLVHGRPKDLAEDLLALVTTEADLGLALIRQEQRE